MQQSGAKAYLVNIGWNGTGKRISIKDTRGIIDAILDGAILNAPTKKLPIFNFEVPTELPGVDPKILDPRDTYTNPEEWDVKAQDLAARFIKNFKKYENNPVSQGSRNSRTAALNNCFSNPTKGRRQSDYGRSGRLPRFHPAPSITKRAVWLLSMQEDAATP